MPCGTLYTKRNVYRTNIATKRKDAELRIKQLWKRHIVKQNKLNSELWKYHIAIINNDAKLRILETSHSKKKLNSELLQ